MHAEPALADNSKLNLPPELVAELQRRGLEPRNDFTVEGWKPSLLGRIMELFSGRRGR